ncbi:MAG: hypothetical protein EKK42_11815 [Pseudonocardiaceae bacterium]|nr:MAG: hypothetical protein EKK42_11815 [Pseudonocardiaceae bacterium]
MTGRKIDPLSTCAAGPTPLVREFDGLISAAVVRAEVLRARGDLDGQVSPEAMPELVHRLARERLRQRLQTHTDR